MRRREFITLLGGATAWPIAARGQQGERMRRIGVHTGSRADDPDGKARFAAFEQALGQLGWTPGRNVRIDYRFSGGDTATSRKQAEELVALAPDVIVTSGSFSTGILLQATRTVPVVFTIVQSVATSAGIDLRPVNLRDAGEIERAISAFARSQNGGLIVTTSALSTVHRDLIIALAARHKLPAVYFQRFFVTAGGLISYGANFIDQYRRAASYDQIAMDRRQ